MALSMRTAQTGKRVYMGARQSPNRGQVSANGAQGYIRRELTKKNQMGGITPYGSDGQTDRRSTVAAQAMQRNSTFNARPGSNQRRPIPGGPKNNQPGHQTGGPKNPQGNPNTNNPNPPGGGGGGNQPAPPPIVQVNEEGILELPYDQDFSLEQLQLLQESNDQLLGLKQEADQQNMEYGQAKREGQLGYDQLRGQTLNQNAARGTAFSSQYGTAVSNNATAFANQMGDLEAQNTNFKNNQALQRAAIQDLLNRQLGLGVQGYTDRLGDQAGELGYDNTKGQHGPGQNNSIYGPNVPKKDKNSKGNKGSKNRKDGNKGGSKKPNSTFHPRKDAAKRALQRRKAK